MITVKVECLLEPKIRVIKHGDVVEEHTRVTRIMDEFDLRGGRTLKDLYDLVAARHPLLRSIVETNRALNLAIRPKDAAIQRHLSSGIRSVPETAWGHELLDGDTVIFRQVAPGY